MTTLHTNLSALFSQRTLTTSQTQLSESVERLSSGLRINRAKDDAAGLGISQELQRQTRSVAVATRNANDAISMVQTAEGAMRSVSDMLLRLKELTTQGANESLSKDQRKFITSEISQLRKEINAVAERTTFNNTKLLTGEFSQQVTREFEHQKGEIQASKLAVKADPTFGVGVTSTSNLAGASVISVASMDTANAQEGTYQFSNDGAKVTLTKTLNGKVETQTLTLTDGGVTGGNSVAIIKTAGEKFTMNFSDFGVSVSFKIDTLGSRRSATDFATLVSSVGQIPAPTGWQTIGGADFATGAPTDQMLVTVTSSGGNLKISQTTGLTEVSGYGAAATWTAGTTATLGFIGTVAQVNAALSTLQVDATNGIGNIDIAVAPQFGNSGFSDTTITSTSGSRVSIPGWNIFRERAILGTTQIGGWTSSNADNAMPPSAPNYSTTGSTGTYTYEFSNNTASGTGTSLRLYSTGIQTDPFGVVHGSYVVSDEAIAIESGDTVKFKWQSVAGGDWYDSYAYLLNVDNGSQVELLDVYGASSNWTTTSVTVNTPGNYKFVFLAGTFDASGGRAAGGSLYLDDIEVIAATPKPGTVKVLNIATGGGFTVDNALAISDVRTTGAGKFTADDGIYRLSANADTKTVTMNYYDEDGTTLLNSETIQYKDLLGAKRTKELTFESLGVSVTLKNNSNEAIRLGEAKSGLDQEAAVTQNRRASLVGDNGPRFQTGEASRNDFATDAFRDIRLGNNIDSQDGDSFNTVNSLIDQLVNANDPATEQFQSLENGVEGLITAITDRRSSFGVLQNRLESTLNNLSEQYENLTSAQSQIQDTDFAWETARLTRMQIGQQSSTAMLAQANAIPNVILALLE